LCELCDFGVFLRVSVNVVDMDPSFG